MEAIVWLVVPLMVTLLVATVVAIRTSGSNSRKNASANRADRLRRVERALVAANRDGGDECR